MAGLSSLSTTIAAALNWTAQLALTGSDYQPVTNPGNISPSTQNGTSIANNMAGGADEIVSYILNIAISSTATVDLTSLTNILQQTGVDLARVKAYMFRLLSPADDPVNGTLCSSITWGNNGSTPQQLNLGTGSAANINNGGTMVYFDESAGGFVVNSGAKILKFVNNDSTSGGTGPTSHAAAIQVSVVGGST